LIAVFVAAASFGRESIMSMRRSLYVLLVLFGFHAVAGAEEPLPEVRIADLNSKFKLIGLLNHPLGTLVKIQGTMAHDPDKAGGAYLRVQRINGVATQQHIPIELEAYVGDFGDPEYGELDGGRIGLGLPKLEKGKAYEFEVYETVWFTGRPQKAYEKAGIWLQSTGFGFRHRFVVITAEELKPITFAPTDFVDREALLQGRATSKDSRAFIAGEGWLLEVDAKEAWPADIEGKTVEGRGVVRKTETADQFQLWKGKTRLVKLEDQVGRKVELRVDVRSFRELWFLDYRGVKLHFDSAITKEDLGKCYAAETVLVTGVLEEAILPDLENLFDEWPPPKAKQYIIRSATCTPAERRLSVEREGNVR
jgi:hypothetical protein